MLNLPRKSRICQSELKNNYKARIYRLNKLKLKLNIILRDVNTLKFSKNHFVLPPFWNFNVLSPLTKSPYYKLLHFYTNTYYFNIVLPVNRLNVTFDHGTRVISFSVRFSSNCLIPYINFVRLIFNVFHKPFFQKIKFKGKGYYLFKNRRNTITPQFGFSHRIYVYSYSVVVKFLTKTKVFLFGLSKQDLLSSSYSIKAMRPINIFTGRGVRFSKQLVYKKTGKVSSYR